MNDAVFLVLVFTGVVAFIGWHFGRKMGYEEGTADERLRWTLEIKARIARRDHERLDTETARRFDGD